ncbi:MAG: iron uptake porin [Rhizonema sp. PD38]|nr:iron uptake porin [Rhizonema sp. PD38]
MSNILWKSLVVSPAVLGVMLASTGAIAAQNPSKSGVVTKAEILQSSKQDAFTLTSGSAATSETKIQIAPVQKLADAQKQTEVNVLDQVNKYSNEGNSNSQSQVTSVSQFSDVQPTDWAFQALQSLVERYGCIAGYPNGTYRGNRALTRYEFAAGLNSCLDRVNELIATATSDIVKKEDLATLQRLQEEFSAELATLRGRVDALESRTAELEANQFSTTTKLVGEAIFALSDPLANRSNDRNNAVFQDRVRLDLQTSFTGKDVLHTRIATGNGNRFDLGAAARPGGGGANGTFEGTQTYQINGDTTNGNRVNLDWLSYYVPIGPANLYIAATGAIHSDYAATVNPYFEDYDGGNGALSTLASRSPIYDIGGGAGAALTFNLGKGGGILKPSSITVGYLASSPNNPALGQGIVNGNYAALGQINFSLSNRFSLAATYVHGYHHGGSAIFDEGGYLGNYTAADGVSRGIGVVGTRQANELIGAAESNSYGIEAAFRPSDKISISGYAGYYDVSGKVTRADDFQAWSYGVGLALPDLGKKGNVLGLFAGAEPYALNRTAVAGGRSIPYHLEGFYKYRVNDNISITPGIIWLTAPGQNEGNDSAIVGTVRTTFTF